METKKLKRSEIIERKKRMQDISATQKPTQQKHQAKLKHFYTQSQTNKWTGNKNNEHKKREAKSKTKKTQQQRRTRKNGKWKIRIHRHTNKKKQKTRKKDVKQKTHSEIGVRRTNMYSDPLCKDGDFRGKEQTEREQKMCTENFFSTNKSF